MQNNCFRHLLAGLCAIAAALLLSTTSTFGQGVTTSGMSGFVQTGSGQAIAGATVTAVHVPTGTRADAITRGNGEYDLVGLHPGGPYTVTVTAPNMPPETKTDVYLDLAGRATVSFTLSSDIVRMQQIQVVGEAASVFNAGQMSLGSDYNAADLQQVVTVRRDLQDVENLDPRAVVMQVSPSDTQFTVSFGGVNPKLNAYLVDGVSAQDNFGLNSNAVAGFRNPIPPEWVESLRVDLNPYDLAFSGASGGFLNVTLKTGTNQFHGSLYSYYQGTNFRGADPVTNTQYGQHEPLQAHTTGVTLGGPIIPNKLFFFAGYEAFRELTVPPVLFFVPDNSVAGAQAQLPGSTTGVYSQIIAKANSYGYDPGTFAAVNHIWNQNFVAKLDWNITDAHQFEFTFRHTIGEAPNYGGTSPAFNSSFGTSLSATWYHTHRTDQSYTAKFLSDWSQIIPNLHTEIEATYKRYNGTATLPGQNFPQIKIDNVPGTSLGGATAPYSLTMGTWWAYQLNNLYTWEQEEHGYAEYSIGDHNFKFGAQFDRTAYTDTFIRNYLGYFEFATPQDWLNGTPTYIQQAAVSPGYTLGSDVSHYYLLDIAPLAEDTWKPNDRLTVMGGVRMDYPYEPQKPIYSPLFYNTFGYRNNTTMNGNYVISPRLGFIYDFPTERKTQLRGGAGLYLGQNPVVWVENSFNGAGQLTTVSTGSTSTSATTKPVAGYVFNGLNSPALSVNPSTAGVEFDVTDKNFKWPSMWKENLTVDHELPWWHFVVTADVDLWQVNKDVFYTNNNLKVYSGAQPSTLPDGRIRYNGNITPGNLGAAYNNGNSYPGTTSLSSTTLEANPAVGPVYYLTNTDKGGTQEYTIMLSRPMTDGWSFSAAYTHTHATAVDFLPSAVAGTNYTDKIFVNPNDDVAYRSQFAVPDKFVVTAAKQFNFFKHTNAKTTLAAQFIAQTGQAYSYVFKGDADGSGISGGSLFYVPSGPNDPKVTWVTSAEENAFFAWLSQNPELAKYAGRVAPRNAFYAPWQHTVNLHLEQQVPIWQSVRVRLFADCYNFANLLNHNWGIVNNYNNSFEVRSVAGTTLNATGTQYVYTFNPATLGVSTIYPDMSRWAVMVGAALEF